MSLSFFLGNNSTSQSCSSILKFSNNTPLTSQIVASQHVAYPSVIECDLLCGWSGFGIGWDVHESCAWDDEEEFDAETEWEGLSIVQLTSNKRLRFQATPSSRKRTLSTAFSLNGSHYASLLHFLTGKIKRDQISHFFPLPFPRNSYNYPSYLEQQHHLLTSVFHGLFLNDLVGCNQPIYNLIDMLPASNYFILRGERIGLGSHAAGTCTLFRYDKRGELQMMCYHESDVRATHASRDKLWVCSAQSHDDQYAWFAFSPPQYPMTSVEISFALGGKAPLTDGWTRCHGLSSDVEYKKFSSGVTFSVGLDASGTNLLLCGKHESVCHSDMLPKLIESGGFAPLDVDSILKSHLSITDVSCTDYGILLLTETHVAFCCGLNLCNEFASPQKMVLERFRRIRLPQQAGMVRSIFCGGKFTALVVANADHERFDRLFVCGCSDADCRSTRPIYGTNPLRRFEEVSTWISPNVLVEEDTPGGIAAPRVSIIKSSDLVHIDRLQQGDSYLHIKLTLFPAAIYHNALLDSQNYFDIWVRTQDGSNGIDSVS